MGLTSLWSNITGSRSIKEITPQTQCSWLEKNRPQSSASTRTVKKLAQLQLKRDDHGETRPSTAQDGKRRMRSLSVSRPKFLEESKKERKASSTRGSGDVPEVPTLPSSLSPRSNRFSDEVLRPGTAITANGSVSTSERFELSGSSLPSPNFQSPLPSPRSPLSPRYPGSPGRRASQEYARSVCGVGLRSRSNSTASSKSKLKRASWFASGGKKKVAEAETPPPLPPPSGLPPPPPVVQPVIAELPATPPALEHDDPCKGVRERPVPPLAKTSLDGDSILNAFPSVPVPVPARKGSNTSQTVSQNSTLQDLNPATTSGIESVDGWPQSHSPSQGPRSRPIAVPMQTIDGIIAPETPKETIRHDSKDLPPLHVEATSEKAKDDHGSLSFGEELQQEYDRLMEVTDEKPHPGVVMEVVGGSESNTQGSQDPQKFSNDEALSKLEFGILQ